MSHTAAIADQLVDQLAERVLAARRAYPTADYGGRVYWCGECRSFDAACAPSDDLVDDYACPACGAPQEPVTAAGVPLGPNRRERRAMRRRRPH